MDSKVNGKLQTNRSTFVFGLLFGGLLWLIAGCVEQIDISIPQENQESLVIQGKLIVGDPAKIEVRLSKLFTFNAESRQPINAREVVLIDENGNELELEDGGLGNYLLFIPADHPTFRVELDKGYFIRVSTFDGRTFESSMEKASPVPKPDELKYQLIDREVPDGSGNLRLQEFLIFTVSSPLRTSESGSNVRLGWEFEHTFRVNDTPFQNGIEQKECYIRQNLNVSDIKVVDAASLLNDRLDNFELYQTRVSRVFGEGLYFIAYQESLDEKAYTYFTQVAENTERTGNMFESPPGKVISNIKNINDASDEAFGFFYVTQQDTIRKYVDPETIGTPGTFCPPPGGLVTEGGECAQPICCDCLSVPNSTTIKPDYWEE